MPDNNNEAVAASVIQSIGNMAFTGNQNKKNRQWASAEAEKAYNRSVEFWNINNEYNNPTSQMNRFLDAGLNPNLIYDKVTGNQAAAAPEYQPAKWEGKAPQMDPSIILAAAKLKSEIAVNNQRIKNMQAQEEGIRASTELTGKKVSLTELQRIAKELDINFKYKPDGLVSTELKNKQLLTQKIQHEIDLKIANAKSAQERVKWQRKKMEVYERVGINIDHSQNSMFGIINNLGRFGIEALRSELLNSLNPYPH
jgi:hypothetical protein